MTFLGFISLPCIVGLVNATTFEELKNERDRSKVLQLLMKHRPEFESIRANILNWNIMDLDSIPAELLREETQLRTQATLDARNSIVDTVFLAAGTMFKPKQMNTSHGRL